MSPPLFSRLFPPRHPQTRSRRIVPRLESLEDRMAPATDIQVEAFTGGGKGNVAVTYQIANETAPEFTLGFFGSADNLWDADDVPLSSVAISDPADLTVGSHTKVFKLGTAAGQVALPGAGAADVLADYFLLAVADPDDLVAEDDADAHNEDNAAVFEGAYHVPRGSVMVHGAPGDDVIKLASGARDLVLNGKLIKYRDDRVLDYRVRAHGGNDQLRGPGLDKRLLAWGGDGNDVLVGGRVKDRLDGGDGDDVLSGRFGNDLFITSTGRDVLRLGQGKDKVNLAALLQAAQELVTAPPGEIQAAASLVSIEFWATLGMSGSVDGCSGGGKVALHAIGTLNADGSYNGTFTARGSDISYRCSDGCSGNASGSAGGDLTGTATDLLLQGSVDAMVRESCPDGADNGTLKLKFKATGTIARDRLSVKLTGKHTGIGGDGEYRQIVTSVS